MPTAQLPELIELSDADVADLLAKESVRGPRTFRGKPLAAYTAGARDLILKVVSLKDSAVFHDCVFVYILHELHAERPEDRFAKRRALIAATDDPDTFRTKVSIEFVDELSDAEIMEVRRVVTDILTPVDLAQVTVAVGVKKAKKAGGSRPTKTR